MIPFFKTCMFLITLSDVVYLGGKATTQTRTDIRGIGEVERNKRGAFSLVRALLATANPVPSMTPVKMFYKKGGVKQAETDFQDLNPTGVKEIANIKYGQVGTYNVDLKKFSPPDHTTLTIHTVQKNSDHTIHYIQRRIIYRD